MALSPIPASVAATLMEAIRAYGRTVRYTPISPAPGVVPADIRALIQRPGEGSLFQEGTQDAFVFWIAGPDAPQRPAPFDRISFDGFDYAVANALAHYLNNAIVAWELHGAGGV
jgi:hypothetical protein